MSKPPFDNLGISVGRLQRMKRHILTLSFPNYRRFRPGTKVTFDFPITIFLGRNGTNKSSLLQALYGCPKGKSVGEFWFETKLDAIPLEVNGLKQSLVYTFMGPNGELQCFKARAPRRGKPGEGKADPDYFEAAKPTMVYGFEQGLKRTNPLAIEVEHIDFRAQLPAFDKYFNFPSEQHLNRLIEAERRRKHLRRRYRKQDYLRRKSAYVINALERDGEALSNEELLALSYVLEREYTSGRVVEHTHYMGHKGSTIVFGGSEHADYSDAFAGSGEAAAALLIRRIIKVPKGALVLLDEPETSLHPRAQQRLLEFLAHQAVKKSLQVVIASHSIDMATGLPQEAVKVLVRADDGFVDVYANIPPQEALHEISSAKPGKTILVEDKHALLLIEGALKKFGTPTVLDEIKVLVRRGGTSRIYADLLTYSHGQRFDVFVMMDGDHRPAAKLPPDADWPASAEGLDKLISCQTKGKNERGPKLDFSDGVDGRRRYLELFRERVYFLPSSTPEAVVWSVTAAEDLLANKKVPSEIESEPGDKVKLKLLAEAIPGMTKESVFEFMLSRFLAAESPALARLRELLSNIRSTSSNTAPRGHP